MGTRQRRREELSQFQAKSLEGRLRVLLTDGLNRSPFEAEAVLDAVHEVYTPFLSASGECTAPTRTPALLRHGRAAHGTMVRRIMPRARRPVTAHIGPRHWSGTSVERGPTMIQYTAYDVGKPILHGALKKLAWTRPDP